MIRFDWYFSNRVKPPTSYGLCGIGYTTWRRWSFFQPWKLAFSTKIGTWPEDFSWRFWGGGQTKGGKGVNMLRLTDFQLSWCFANFFCSMYTLKRHFFFEGKMIISLPWWVSNNGCSEKNNTLITLHHGKNPTGGYYISGFQPSTSITHLTTWITGPGPQPYPDRLRLSGMVL